LSSCQVFSSRGGVTSQKWFKRGRGKDEASAGGGKKGREQRAEGKGERAEGGKAGISL